MNDFFSFFEEVIGTDTNQTRDAQVEEYNKENVSVLFTVARQMTDCKLFRMKSGVFSVRDAYGKSIFESEDETEAKVWFIQMVMGNEW